MISQFINFINHEISYYISVFQQMFIKKNIRPNTNFFFNKHFRDDFHRIIHEAQLV